MLTIFYFSHCRYGQPKKIKLCEFKAANTKLVFCVITTSQKPLRTSNCFIPTQKSIQILSLLLCEFLQVTFAVQMLLKLHFGISGAVTNMTVILPRGGPIHRAIPSIRHQNTRQNTIIGTRQPHFATLLLQLFPMFLSRIVTRKLLLTRGGNIAQFAPKSSRNDRFLPKIRSKTIIIWFFLPIRTLTYPFTIGVITAFPSRGFHTQCCPETVLPTVGITGSCTYLRWFLPK